MKSTEIVTYNGREYRLLWRGATKFGDRAHLGYMDGSKDFWVSADKLGKSTASAATTSAPARRPRVYSGRPSARRPRVRSAAQAVTPGALTPEQQEAALAAMGRAWAVTEDGQPTKEAGFASDGPVTLGGIVTFARKGQPYADPWLVVTVDKPYYHTEDECEDMDCFCGNYGWKYPYTAHRVTLTPGELAKRKAAGEAADVKQARRALFVLAFQAPWQCRNGEYRAIRQLPLTVLLTEDVEPRNPGSLAAPATPATLETDGQTVYYLHPGRWDDYVPIAWSHPATPELLARIQAAQPQTAKTAKTTEAK